MSRARARDGRVYSRIRRSQINTQRETFSPKLTALFSPCTLSVRRHLARAQVGNTITIRVIHCYAYKSGTKRSRHSRIRRVRPAASQVPFDPFLSLLLSPSRSLFLNFSGSGEIIRQLARPCSYSNTYIHRPLRCLLPEGRGLFKLKSRQDLNFKISIWLANLSASFRPCASERTTAFPPPPRRGQIARVQHQKSFTSRALFPPSPVSRGSSARSLR